MTGDGGNICVGFTEGEISLNSEPHLLAFEKASADLLRLASRGSELVDQRTTTDDDVGGFVMLLARLRAVQAAQSITESQADIPANSVEDETRSRATATTVVRTLVAKWRLHCRLALCNIMPPSATEQQAVQTNASDHGIVTVSVDLDHGLLCEIGPALYLSARSLQVAFAAGCRIALETAGSTQWLHESDASVAYASELVDAIRPFCTEAVIESIDEALDAHDAFHFPYR